MTQAAVYGSSGCSSESTSIARQAQKIVTPSFISVGPQVRRVGIPHTDLYVAVTILHPGIASLVDPVDHRCPTRRCRLDRNWVSPPHLSDVGMIGSVLRLM